MKNTLIDNLMRSTLFAHANYSEKQLLKAGETEKCAEQLIRRRRKSVRNFSGLFSVILVLPILAQAVATFFMSSVQGPLLLIGPFCLLALLQVPTLIELKMTLARLETLVAVWLMADRSDDESDTAPESSDLVNLIFSAQQPDMFTATSVSAELTASGS